VKLSNSGSDENGRYKNGKAGDQNGREWYIRDWYNYPWNCVLRHPLAEVRACLATLAYKAAQNDNIGYDQNQRDDYGIELAKADYDPSKITKPVESDCSKGVIDNVKATGYILGMPELQRLDATYTGNMRNGFNQAGFIVLTDPKYLTGSDYLMAGDILLNDKHHTATVVTNGPKATTTISMPLVKRGSTGTAVVQLQKMLNKVSYRNQKKLSEDGDFGPNTQSQVIFYQMDRGLTPDGEVGPNTWNRLFEDVY
ncbi:MAG: peptidoglycan-binding protein, partial [Succinivibrio sp.]|nr:peptidoglycan-binding protein [Succinivibrio sp.]